MKTYFAVILKCIISCGLIWILLSEIDVLAAVDRVLEANPYILSITAVIFALQMLIGGARWGFVLTSIKAPLALLETTRLFYIGAFFSQVLPSSVGGDGIRMFLSYKYGLTLSQAINSVMIERVRDRFDQNSSESQPLLEPATLDLAPGAMTTVQENLEDLNRAGWGVEEFGMNSLIVRSVPAALATRASGDGAGKVFLGVLDELGEGGSGETWRNRLLATIACHSSIRAGQILSIDECKDLIRQLEQVQRPNTCPHGRPTVVQLNINDLEREFKRT